MQVGLVGKPNAGKSTFFSAATLVDVAIANYPFTTIKPSHGVTHIRTKCVCTELGVNDSARNSTCLDGDRFIPVDLVDLPGLVPGASEGKGLGNQFLDEIRRADALIQVVDASGSTDSDGKLVSMGSHDPLKDIEFLNLEVESWILQHLKKDLEKMGRQPLQSLDSLVIALSEKLSGLGIKRSQVEKALEDEKIPKRPSAWLSEDLIRLAHSLRESSKPTIIAANKVDLPSAASNVERLKDTESFAVPVCAEAELALRKAAHRGLIKYTPGDAAFTEMPGAPVTSEQKAALDAIERYVLKPFGSTGVQRCINSAFLNLLDMIVVYPVEDSEKMTDHAGHVLPDAILVQRGTNLRQLAFKIHTELGDNFLYGVNARNNMRLGESYVLQDGDIVSVVSTTRRR